MSIRTRRLNTHTLTVSLHGYARLGPVCVRLNRMQKPAESRNPFPWVYAPDGSWHPFVRAEDKEHTARKIGDLITLLALYCIDHHIDLPATSLSARPHVSTLCSHPPYLITSRASLFWDLRFDGERPKRFSRGPYEAEMYIQKFARVIESQRAALRPTPRHTTPPPVISGPPPFQYIPLSMMPIIPTRNADGSLDPVDMMQAFYDTVGVQIPTCCEPNGYTFATISEIVTMAERSYADLGVVLSDYLTIRLSREPVGHATLTVTPVRDGVPVEIPPTRRIGWVVRISD